MMSYIQMFGKDTHKTLHVTYRSYTQKKLNQMQHVSFLIGGTREKICAKNGSYRIYIRIRVSVFGRRTLKHIAMKYTGAPNFTSINPLERVASWSYTIVEEIISFESEKVNH